MESLQLSSQLLVSAARQTSLLNLGLILPPQRLRPKFFREDGFCLSTQKRCSSQAIEMRPSPFLARAILCGGDSLDAEK